MAEFATPQKPKRENQPHGLVVEIPPSPFLKKLGYGTGVAVYKMERSPLASRVRSPWAIKKLLKSYINPKQISLRLKEEAGILRALDHPNIIGFRAFVKGPDGKDCLVMEECTNSLGDLIEKRSEIGLLAFETKKIIKVSCDIAEALHYLHDTALILHCDIKSYNILVKGDFVISKLCDFGVSMPLNKDGSLNEKKIVERNDVIEFRGTKLWSPAEVLRVNPVITSKADIFSFGLTIWEMLALCPPHCYENIIDISSDSMDVNTDVTVNRIEDTSIDVTDASVDVMDASVDVTDASIGEGKDSEKVGGLGQIGIRPALPAQEFDKDYYSILQLFFCCTEEDWKKRPTAAELCFIMDDINQDVVFID